MARLIIAALTIALLAVPLIGSPAAAGRPKCNGLKATIVGNDKSNVIYGTGRRDVIVAKGGNDKIYGRGGKDVICAGNGKDIILGGGGRDKIFGGEKNDTLKGGAGRDLLNGGKGKDICYGNADGATKVACEGADLRVRVTAPETVTVGETFVISVQVKNVGVLPAANARAVLEYDENNVTCRLPSDPSGTYKPGEKPGLLVPGEDWIRLYSQYCQVPIGSPATATMAASATTTSADDNPGNDAAGSTTTVDNP